MINAAMQLFHDLALCQLAENFTTSRHSYEDLYEVAVFASSEWDDTDKRVDRHTYVRYQLGLVVCGIVEPITGQLSSRSLISMFAWRFASDEETRWRLQSAGYEGILKAALRYEPAGATFPSYAKHQILREMTEESRLDWHVGVSRRDFDNIRWLRKREEELAKEDGEWPSPEDLLEDVAVQERLGDRALDVMAMGEVSFSDMTTIAEDNEDEQSVDLDVLTDREREVVELVRLDYSLKEIADKLGITPQSVGRIRDRAVDKLKVQNKAQ